MDCKNCGVEIDEGRKFCSRSCSATFNNSAQPKRSLTTGRCSCGKRKSNGALTCRDCYRRTLQEWLDGTWDGSTERGALSLTIREFLMETHPECVRCGWKEVHPTLGYPPLEVNHIDGNASNNQRVNLEVICPNCHSLTPNFRRLNANSSRSYRR